MNKKIRFFKYQGTGNDFIIPVDLIHPLQKEEIQMLCQRKFGIGSDGLMDIKPLEDGSLKVDFYNPDGSESFCGNGSRCALRFAQDMGWTGEQVVFHAFDGKHHGKIQEDLVKIEMFGRSEIQEYVSGYFINTGAPHVVVKTENLSATDVKQAAEPIRWDEAFAPVGTNVNFYEEIQPGKITIRTFEKGVEDETLSCGTGVTACAMVYKHSKGIKNDVIEVETLGGNLLVEFSGDSLYLCGPAEKVFEGEVVLS